MKTRASFAASLLLAAHAASASEFLDALHRADARGSDDPERIEFATRAVKSWKPSDGQALLAHAHFRRAEAELSRLDDDAAEADLNKVLSLDPRNEKAKLLRARARLSLGRAAEAEKDFSDYAAARGEDGEGWLGIAESRIAQGPPRADKPAQQALRKAKPLLGDDPRVWLAEGRAHMACGRAQAALVAFDSAEQKAKDLKPDALAWRARAKALLGNPEGARRDLTEALPGLEQRLEQRRRGGASARAEENARASLAEARLRRGKSEEVLGRGEDCLEDYRQACDLGSAEACALLAAAPKKIAVEPRLAPPPKKPRKANPKSEPGERIYAN